MSKTTFRKKFHSTKNLKISKPVEAGGRGGEILNVLTTLLYLIYIKDKQKQFSLLPPSISLTMVFFTRIITEFFFLVQKFQFISIQTSFQKSQNGIFLSLLQVSFAIYHFLFTEKLSFLRSFEKS